MRYQSHTSRSSPTPLPSGSTVHTPSKSYRLPALVVDVEAMQRNLVAMIQFLGNKGVQARPHAKTHKCPVIAHRQIGSGAIGICCAKVSEAEVMFHSGIESILITSPVVTEDKIQRVVDLTRLSGGSVAVVIDSEKGADLLSEMARRDNVTVPVLIDIDPGTHRTGIAPGEPAVELARLAAEIERPRTLGSAGLRRPSDAQEGLSKSAARPASRSGRRSKTPATRSNNSALPCRFLPALEPAPSMLRPVSAASPISRSALISSWIVSIARSAGRTRSEIYAPFESSLFVLDQRPSANRPGKDDHHRTPESSRWPPTRSNRS